MRRRGTKTAIVETGCEIHGLGRAMSRMKKATGSLEGLQPAFRRIADHGANQLRKLVPVRTGHLKGTIKSLKRARKATVSIGTRKYWYGVFPNYGTKYQKAQNFVDKAINASYPYAQFMFHKEVEKKLRIYGLD
ncbi:HK97-gp10 family putative phage morphogenesis protein [Mobiluncus mulieris]|uniref:Phage protein, HK97 gp10 family n=3 Tax=Mobiluncus mulieris TaxID=2052 RepID=E0QPP8_9ACTO|nr:HK97-gp10 family putative phage morphogenesis protein [Mobiluncus mulieris]EFM46468.1 phage protein, HK97 gp10 family [Mobiluncus mulieris ATCC 35239]MCU9968464.1 hypothetical protein [Mobiluncus mulieris]MCU9970476.1 hypothetical protein [Mobiluncus mulieris]MCU9972697.1 hypothetical protein [Mobiluncus mulieris]MCU9993181.1 hypothetical protein [Mobiluncus mulieris]